MPHFRNKPLNEAQLVMVILRCLLAFLYLWIMLYAAALVPVLIEESKWFLWIEHLKYCLTFTSMLPFDLFSQTYVIFMVIILLYRLFGCCRCNFFNKYGPDTIRNADKVPFNKRLFFFFGPYQLTFLVCWLNSVVTIASHILRIYNHNDSGQKAFIYYSLSLALLFKFLVIANVSNRFINCWSALKKFNEDPEDELHNPYNFGEHLNFFLFN